MLVLSAWLHYGLGKTLSQIVEVFNFHLQMKLTSGGLVQLWYRLQAILYPWYEQIQARSLALGRACTPTRPAGGSTARRIGCGASRRRT